MLSKPSFSFVAVFVALLFLNFSCEDHVVQQYPSLETLNYLPNCKSLFAYNLKILETGNVAVKEYGVVYSATEPLVSEPTVENNIKVIFDSPFTAGDKSQLAPGQCVPQTYYRAYAILENDVVIYGNTIHFSDN